MIAQQKDRKKSKNRLRKEQLVKELVEIAKSHKVVGIADLSYLPARQLSDIRAKLRGKAKLIMTKKTLIKLVLENLKDSLQGIEKLEDHLRGQVAFIFSDVDAFRLFKLLKENRSTAPLKAGQVASKDVWIKAGPTSFTPGPIIGQLGKLGLKTGVEQGKIVIKEDKLVLKEGEVASAELANILARLGIEPNEIGVNLLAAYEDGVIFTKDVLDVDEKQYLDNLIRAHQDAMALALELPYYTKEVIEQLLVKAVRDAKVVAVEHAVYDKEVVEDLIKKAYVQAQNLKSKSNFG